MIIGQDILLNIAQIALTLAGFSALLSVFRRGDEGWSEEEIIGQRLILELSFASAAFSVLPLAIFHTLGEAPVWRVSSGLLIGFTVLWGLFSRRRSKEVSAGTPQPRSRVWVIGQASSLVAMIIQGVNVVVWGSFSGYIWGILWLAFSAGLQFMLFVYAYTDAE